jgi:tetratricopeptide (TPR) repeat protein
MLAPMRAVFLTFLGRLEEALELLDSACEAARLNGNRHALAWGLFTRAITHHQRGDLEAALADGAEALELSQDTDAHNTVACWAGLALGSTLIERGDAARGVEVMLELAGGETMAFVPGAWRAYSLDRLVAGLLADGRPVEAAAAVREAAALAERTGLQLAAMAAERAAARLALAGGDAGTGLRLRRRPGGARGAPPADRAGRARDARPRAHLRPADHDGHAGAGAAAAGLPGLRRAG